VYVIWTISWYLYENIKFLKKSNSDEIVEARANSKTSMFLHPYATIDYLTTLKSSEPVLKTVNRKENINVVSN